MTITVTALIFSGRQNPAWVLAANEEKALLQDLAATPGVVQRIGDMGGGLGYAGLQIDQGSETLAAETGLPARFFIHTGQTLHEDKAQQIAARLAGVMFDHVYSWETYGDTSGPDAGLRSLLLDEIGQGVARGFNASSSITITEDTLAGHQSTEPRGMIAESRGCTVESGEYKPGFWNDAGIIQYNNNCYCYAANRRIDKFGQPGKGGGRPVARPFTVENVRAALLTDGLKPFGTCLPAAESPRYLVAMVVAPFRPNDPRYNDYHFYRNSVQSLSNQIYFWSHKMGQFPVTNLDKDGRIIANVERANRDKYTLFGGYYYLPRSARIAGNPPGADFGGSGGEPGGGTG